MWVFGISTESRRESVFSWLMPRGGERGGEGRDCCRYRFTCDKKRSVNRTGNGIRRRSRFRRQRRRAKVETRTFFSFNFQFSKSRRHAVSSRAHLRKVSCVQLPHAPRDRQITRFSVPGTLEVCSRVCTVRRGEAERKKESHAETERGCRSDYYEAGSRGSSWNRRSRGRIAF